MPDSRALVLISQVLNSTSKQELFSTMERAAKALGFDNVLYGIRVDVPVGDPVQHIASGYPAEYQRIYLERQFIARDPTVYHALTRPQLLVWNDGIYDEKSRDIMEESRKYGLGHGLSAPVHEGPSIRGMLSLARDRPFENSKERDQLEAGANVLANAVHVATTKIILPEVIADQRPALSDRELECLRWVAQGKSNFAIGRLLSISEGTVKFHMGNVLVKLGVATRQQAITRGMLLGLIT